MHWTKVDDCWISPRIKEWLSEGHYHSVTAQKTLIPAAFEAQWHTQVNGAFCNKEVCFITEHQGCNALFAVAESLSVCALSSFNSSPHNRIEGLSSSTVMLNVTFEALMYEHGMLRLGYSSQSIGRGKNTEQGSFSEITKCYTSIVNLDLVKDMESFLGWVEGWGSAFGKLHDRLWLRGIFWTQQLLCFLRGLFLILAAPLCPHSCTHTLLL